MRCLGEATAAALIVLGTAGCSEYLDRRDGVLLGAGEAVQTNIVTHTIDPWPAHARNTQAATDGERARRAVERYRNPQVGGAGPASAGAEVVGSAPPPMVR